MFLNQHEIDYINQPHKKFSQFIKDHQILDEQIRQLELNQLYNQPKQLDNKEQEEEIKKMTEQFEKDKLELEKKRKEENNKKQQLVPLYETIQDQKFPYDLEGIIEISDDDQF